MNEHGKTVIKTSLIRIVKDPLLHFLVFGLGLFVAYGYVTRNDVDIEPNRIVVDRERLLIFMQYRAKIFESNRFNDLLDQLSEPQLQNLIAEYVREEALYREAKALSLDRNDYFARRRLIQQLESITRDLITADSGISEEDLQVWYDARKHDYAIPNKITFTHVFFRSDKHGEDMARTLALKKLHELNDNHVPFHAAMSHGDRFLYHNNYVEKEEDEIDGHFGQAMRKQLFALAPDDQVWRGPIRSDYGFHLLLLTTQAAGYVPPLAEIRDKVEQDALQMRLDTEAEEIIHTIIDNYEIDIVAAIQQPAEHAAVR